MNYVLSLVDDCLKIFLWKFDFIVEVSFCFCFCWIKREVKYNLFKEGFNFLIFLFIVNWG